MKKEIVYGNITIIVERPELTEQDQKEREQKIKRALQHFAIAGGSKNER